MSVLALRPCAPERAHTMGASGGACLECGQPTPKELVISRRPAQLDVWDRTTKLVAARKGLRA